MTAQTTGGRRPRSRRCRSLGREGRIRRRRETSHAGASGVKFRSRFRDFCQSRRYLAVSVPCRSRQPVAKRLLRRRERPVSVKVAGRRAVRPRKPERRDDQPGDRFVPLRRPPCGQTASPPASASRHTCQSAIGKSRQRSARIQLAGQPARQRLLVLTADPLLERAMESSENLLSVRRIFIHHSTFTDRGPTVGLLGGAAYILDEASPAVADSGRRELPGFMFGERGVRPKSFLYL